MAQVKNIPLIESTLREYILRKFKEGEKIVKTDNGFAISEINLEAVHNINEYNLTITPKEGLIKSFFIEWKPAENIMFFFKDLFESQETSHIIDEIKRLK